MSDSVDSSLLLEGSIQPSRTITNDTDSPRLTDESSDAEATDSSGSSDDGGKK